MRPELISQPITGICSFGRYPICLDLDRLDADFGVLGVPFDMGVGFLSGARIEHSSFQQILYGSVSVCYIVPAIIFVFQLIYKVFLSVQVINYTILPSGFRLQK